MSKYTCSWLKNPNGKRESWVSANSSDDKKRMQTYAIKHSKNHPDMLFRVTSSYGYFGDVQRGYSGTIEIDVEYYRNGEILPCPHYRQVFKKDETTLFETQKVAHAIWLKQTFIDTKYPLKIYRYTTSTYGRNGETVKGFWSEAYDGYTNDFVLNYCLTTKVDYRAFANPSIPLFNVIKKYLYRIVKNEGTDNQSEMFVLNGDVVLQSVAVEYVKKDHEEHLRQSSVILPKNFDIPYTIGVGEIVLDAVLDTDSLNKLALKLAQIVGGLNYLLEVGQLSDEQRGQIEGVKTALSLAMDNNGM
jgi:hypothetical protein